MITANRVNLPSNQFRVWMRQYGVKAWFLVVLVITFFFYSIIFTEEVRRPMPPIPSLVDVLGMNANFLDWLQWLCVDVLAHELGLYQLSQSNFVEYGAVATLWLFFVRLFSVILLKETLGKAKIFLVSSTLPGPRDEDENKDVTIQFDHPSSDGRRAGRPLVHCICIRLLTRGDQEAHPFIDTAVTTAITLINEMINCDHLKAHIVTHKQFLDEKTRLGWLQKGATEVQEMLVPETYTTPRGTLFKARNICYWQLVKGGVGSECDETRSWILSLDEEAVITRSMLRSFIIDVLNSPDGNDVGYALPVPMIDVTVGQVPFINKTIEAGWVAYQYCLMAHNRASNTFSNCEFHGGCYFAKASVDRGIGNDWGPAASLCDDYCIGIEAHTQKVRFKYLNGWFYEGTTTSFKSLVTQRARIIRGITYAIFTLPMNTSLRVTQIIKKIIILPIILPISLSIICIIVIVFLIQFKPLGPRCIVLDILTLLYPTVTALDFVFASTYMDMSKRDIVIYTLASPLIVYSGLIAFTYTLITFHVFRSLIEEWKRGTISYQVTPKPAVMENDAYETNVKKTI